MEQIVIKEVEVVRYTIEEFIRATRADGLGHIYVDGVDCGGMREVLCDCCGEQIVQPEDNPGKLVVFLLLNRAWCRDCFLRWAEWVIRE